jgi:hypothetical protein
VLQGLQRSHEALKAGSAQTQRLLDALESLLTLDADADPFPRVFASLRRVFTFTHALMLTQDAHAEADGLCCTVAEPAEAVGQRWPLTPLLRKVLAGRVVATVPTAPALADGEPAALALPAGAGARAPRHPGPAPRRRRARLHARPRGPGAALRAAGLARAGHPLRPPDGAAQPRAAPAGRAAAPQRAGGPAQRPAAAPGGGPPAGGPGAAQGRPPAADEQCVADQMLHRQAGQAFDEQARALLDPAPPRGRRRADGLSRAPACSSARCRSTAASTPC